MTPARRTPPLSTREIRQRTQPRRMLTLQGSATYCDVSPRVFSRLVRMHRAPQPKVIAPGIERWDIQQLDDFLDTLPSRGGVTPAARPKPRLFNL